MLLPYQNHSINTFVANWNAEERTPRLLEGVEYHFDTYPALYQALLAWLGATHIGRLDYSGTPYLWKQDSSQNWMIGRSVRITFRETVQHIKIWKYSGTSPLEVDSRNAEGINIYEVNTQDESTLLYQDENDRNWLSKYWHTRTSNKNTTTQKDYTSVKTGISARSGKTIPLYHFHQYQIAGMLWGSNAVSQSDTVGYDQSTDKRNALSSIVGSHKKHWGMRRDSDFAAIIKENLTNIYPDNNGNWDTTNAINIEYKSNTSYKLNGTTYTKNPSDRVFVVYRRPGEVTDTILNQLKTQFVDQGRFAMIQASDKAVVYGKDEPNPLALGETAAYVDYAKIVNYANRGNWDLLSNLKSYTTKDFEITLPNCISEWYELTDSGLVAISENDVPLAARNTLEYKTLSIVIPGGDKIGPYYISHLWGPFYYYAVCLECIPPQVKLQIGHGLVPKNAQSSLTADASSSTKIRPGLVGYQVDNIQTNSVTQKTTGTVIAKVHWSANQLWAEGLSGARRDGGTTFGNVMAWGFFRSWAGVIPPKLSFLQFGSLYRDEGQGVYTDFTPDYRHSLSDFPAFTRGAGIEWPEFIPHGGKMRVSVSVRGENSMNVDASLIDPITPNTSVVLIWDESTSNAWELGEVRPSKGWSDRTTPLVLELYIKGRNINSLYDHDTQDNINKHKIKIWVEHYNVKYQLYTDSGSRWVVNGNNTFDISVETHSFPGHAHYEYNERHILGATLGLSWGDSACPYRAVDDVFYRANYSDSWNINDPYAVVLYCPKDL